MISFPWFCFRKGFLAKKNQTNKKLQSVANIYGIVTVVKSTEMHFLLADSNKRHCLEDTALSFHPLYQLRIS